MIYLTLFLTYLKIGLFSIGGGYASLPIIQEEIITKHAFITQAEFTDILTISQMTPGPIAINSATFVGTTIGGFRGSLVATLGFVLPSLVIVILLSYFLFKYKSLTVITNTLNFLKPIVVGVIGSVAIGLVLNAVFSSVDTFEINIRGLIIFSACCIALCNKKTKVEHIIPLSAILGILLY